MARAFRSSRPARGARRETVWANLLPASTTLASASSASLIGVGNAALLALRPFTIVRIRGTMEVHSDQQATTESQQVGLGFSIVTEVASSIGITAVPTPYADMGSDMFMLYEQVYCTQRLISQAGFTEPTGVLHQFSSKAMRKVNGDQDIAIVLENSAISSGSITVVGLRFLIKLH